MDEHLSDERQRLETSDAERNQHVPITNQYSIPPHLAALSSALNAESATSSKRVARRPDRNLKDEGPAMTCPHHRMSESMSVDVCRKDEEPAITSIHRDHH